MLCVFLDKHMVKQLITSVVVLFVLCMQVFPIFIISIADCLLALTWVVGGIIWLAGIDAIEHREWCFLPSLLTVVCVCVCV